MWDVIFRICFRHKKTEEKSISAGTQIWPNSLIGTFQTLISFFTLMACMPWTVCILHTHTHTHTHILVNDTIKLDSFLFLFPLHYNKELPFRNLHQDFSQKAVFYFGGFKKCHWVKDEGLREDGRVCADFPMTETFCSLQRLRTAARLSERHLGCRSILSPLLSFAVATAKLEIESVVTALIALCQNWCEC